MKAVAKSTSKGDGNNQALIKFESLDHFALESIDLQYNKISFLVIQTVEKLIKNLH